MQARKTKKVSIIIAALTVSVFILFDVFDVSAGRMEPTSAPAPTMHNLNEVYHNIAPAVPSNWAAMPSHTQPEGTSAIHMKLDDGGIQGSCTAAGKEETVVIVGLEHNISYPLSTQGQPTGTREHDPISVIKYIDKSSPFLYQKLCQGQQMQEMELKFYRLDNVGAEEHYYTILLTNVHVVGIKTYFPNMEYVSFAYGTIRWTWEDGSIEYPETVPGGGGG